MMDMLSAQLIQSLSDYGLWVILCAVMAGSIGVPVPVSLLLLSAGALAGQGTLPVEWLVFFGLVGAISGDHVGYFLGRWGGQPLLRRLERWMGQHVLANAHTAMQARGWSAVFLSRWLVAPMCAPCNWLCGSVQYPLRSFLIADVLGEGMYICGLIMAGFIWSDYVTTIATTLASVGPWLLVAALGILAVRWAIRRTVVASAA